MQTKDFFTLLPKTKGNFSINHKVKISLWGSCFAEHMEPNFAKGGFHVNSNPFGVIFNSRSLRTLFSLIDSEKEISFEHTVEKDGMWTSWLFHSSFSHKSQAELLNMSNELFNCLKRDYIENTHTFIISLGTAWIYKLKELDIVVANCHKQKKEMFRKKLLTTEEIQEDLETIVEVIRKLNPENKIIFTLSPVRHIKDGFVENNRSKARLTEAILSAVSNKESTCYFESYELMMDQLRDYRFYEKDLLHPNDTARQIIWQHFGQKYFEQSCLNASKSARKYYDFKDHRLLNKTRENIKNRESQLLVMREMILLEHPNIKLV